MRRSRIALLTLALLLTLAALTGVSAPSAYASCSPGRCVVASDCYNWCCLQYGACDNSALCKTSSTGCGLCLC